MSGRGPTDVEELIAQAAGLRRLAVRLVGESDADDVLQDAVAAGLARAPGDALALRHWLVRVVRNLASTRHRAAGRRSQREHAAARPERHGSTTDLVARMEVQRLVAEEVLRLDEPYRTAVLAVYFEGESAEDFARERGVPGATVRSWLRRGLDALRARLDRRSGGDRAAWSACLAPLVRTEAAAIPLAIGGGLVLKKLLAAAVVVVLAALVAWAALGVGSGPDSADIARASVELVASGSDEARVALAPAESTEARAEIAEAAQPVAKPPPRSVGGRVVWVPDRAPASDVGVQLSPLEYRPDLGAPPTIVTDAEGRFRFDAVAVGAHDLSLDRVQSATRVSVGPDAPVEIELTMRRAFRVFGRVLAPDGKPVANAEVCVSAYAERPARCVTRSAADGSYSVDGMTHGPALFARAPGHADSGTYGVRDETRHDDPLRKADVRAPYPLDLWLGGAPGAVEGRVTSAAGDVAAGMHLELITDREGFADPAGVAAGTALPELATTDARGAFAFTGQRSGRATLHVHTLHRTRCSVVVDVRAGETTRADVVLPAMARVRGRIADSTGAGVPGAQFEAALVDGRTATSSIGADDDGRYDTGFVPAGRVKLVARHSRGRAELVTDLAPGEDREWSPVLGAAKAPIRGRVVDVAGRPLAGIPVSYGSRRQNEVATDAGGRFELLADAGAFQWVIAWGEGSVHAAEAREVWPGGPDVELVFDPPSARIRGRLVDAAGAPAGRMRVSCEGRNAETDAAGRFETPLLSSGKRSLSVYGYGVGRCHLIDVEVAPGEDRDVGDVVLPARGTLVVAPKGDGQLDLARVQIFAHRLGAELQVAGHVDDRASRDWIQDGLPVGEYRVFATGGGVALVERRCTVRAGETTLVDLELHRGAPVRVDVRGERVTSWTLEVRDAAGELVGTHERRTWDPECVLSLRPGRHELVATLPDGRTGRARVEVAGGAAPQQDVVVEVR